MNSASFFPHFSLFSWNLNIMHALIYTCIYISQSVCGSVISVIAIAQADYFTDAFLALRCPY